MTQEATTRAERSASRGVPLIVGAIAAAWVLAIAAQTTGAGKQLHHGPLIEGHLPLLTAVVLFLLAWQAMTASMMLPSSLPLIRLFGTVASAQPRPVRAKAAFVGGYAVVWSTFGAAAFLADIGIHSYVDAHPWLDTRPWLIAGPTLMLAGAFQFSGLKDRCLTKCRHPAAFLLPRYRRGARAAFRLGREHGVFCLGCCWSLMLVGFGAGVANLWWMAALTAVMVVEKTAPGGDRIVKPLGVLLLAGGALVALHPSWLSLQPWAA